VDSVSVKYDLITTF